MGRGQRHAIAELPQLLAGELASSGGVADRHDQQADVMVVDAADGLAQADGRPVGEAGGEAEHPAFAVLTELTTGS